MQIKLKQLFLTNETVSEEITLEKHVIYGKVALAMLLVTQAPFLTNNEFETFNTYFKMSREHRRIFTNSSSIKRCKYEFRLAWASAPHPEKAWKGGQDALYASPNVLIVADGVSAWSNMGIDAGIYSRRLITLAQELIESDKKMYYIENPQQLAINIVQKNVQKGSATLSILTLNPHTGLLKSYHVGDSVYGLFKKNGSSIVVEQQQSAFNVPYQVFGGNINVIKNNGMAEPQQVSDVFSGISDQFTLEELKESYIVLASDGLWDNLRQEQIQKQLMSSAGCDLVEKTMNLMDKAKYYSDLQMYESPFYHKALKYGHKVSKGGKVDDTTMILAEVMAIESMYQISF